ncbi:MAG: alpha/beta hydrolase [Beijerinckiaceae bacterium]
MARTRRDAFVETGMIAPGPEGALRGTLCQPMEAACDVCVVIVPGSGPTDRNGNQVALFPCSLEMLAHGLADAGIASLRVDKRGMYGSVMALANANDVAIGEYADDVATWASEIRSQTGMSRVYVLGHSEGGLVALVVAAQRQGVNGVVHLCAASRPFAEVLLEQLGPKLPDAALRTNLESVIAALASGKSVDAADIAPPLFPLFGPHIQRLMISSMSHDPAQLAADLDMPMLVVRGRMDFQIKIADVQRLVDANANAELRIFDTMNHVLKTVSSPEPAAQANVYRDPAIPLADGLTAAIANFILRNEQRRA